MYSFEAQYLIFTGYDLDIRGKYPAIYNHLKEVGDRLEKTPGKGKGLYNREDQGQHWWNLRACDYYDEFEQEKVSWGNLGLKTQATSIPKGIFISAPAPLISPANNYILSILNSKLGDWYIRQCGVTRSGGYFEYKPMYVEQLPIPKATYAQQSIFIQIVGKILTLTDSDDYSYYPEKQAQVKDYEKQIDHLVYKLYGLTEEEINTVEDQTSASVATKSILESTPFKELTEQPTIS